MRKLFVAATASAAILLAGSLAWKAEAQTSRPAAIVGSGTENFSPVERGTIQPAACRGWGRHCPPGRIWVCRPRGCFCRWC